MKATWSLFMIFLIFSTLTESALQNSIDDEYSDYNEKIYKKYQTMDKQLKRMAEQGVKRLLPVLLESSEHVNISATCSKNLFDLITGFRKLTTWSLNFLDAIGKPQSGIQVGNAQMFGEYGECVETLVVKRGKVDFKGQYCVTQCQPYLPKVKKFPGLFDRLEGLINATRNTSDFTKQFVLRAQGFYTYKINIGLCIPSGCSKEDISEILNYSIGDYINCRVTHCLKDGDIYFWDKGRTIAVSVLVLLGAIVLLSTYLDNTLQSWKNNTLGVKSRILQCFSVTRNFPKLMNTDISKNSITCLNGVRVLTIFWIILGHEFMSHALFLTANHASVNFEKVMKSFFSQMAVNGFISVDMFFFISGFVNCYTRMLIKQEGKSQPGILKTIVHRLWRIYPAYIMAFVVMYPLSKPSPIFYHDSKTNTDNCNENWWKNFLFINNFFNLYRMCLAHSWFLCVDMQLFLVTLMTIPILIRKPKKGIILHIGIILIVNCCSMSWWLKNEDLSPATLDTTKLDLTQSVKRYSIYVLAPVHVGSYIIGILLGYIIATKKEIKISRICQFFGWLAACVLFMSMLFITVRWNSGIPYSQLESSFYGAWSGTIAVLGFSWLVFCCATGHGGIINYILSLRLWIPLSRITYMIYLLSPTIQRHFYNSLEFPEDFTNIKIIWNYFGNLTVSVLMSFALVLIAESPMITMEKILFRRHEGKSKTTNEFPKELPHIDVKGKEFQENGNIASIYL